MQVCAGCRRVVRQSSHLHCACLGFLKAYVCCTCNEHIDVDKPIYTAPSFIIGWFGGYCYLPNLQKAGMWRHWKWSYGRASCHWLSCQTICFKSREHWECTSYTPHSIIVLCGLKPSYGQACVHESDKWASSFAVFQAVFSSTVVRHSSFIIPVHLMIIKVLCFNPILNWFWQLVSGDSQNQLDLLEPGY